MGNRGFKEGDEGAKYKNVIFTNALGPVFVKNPWYTEHIIKEAMLQKGITIETRIDEKEFEIELESAKCIKQFIDKKKKVGGTDVSEIRN